MTRVKRAEGHIRLQNGLVAYLTTAERELFGWFQDQTYLRRPRSITISYREIGKATGKSPGWIKLVVDRLAFKGYLTVEQTYGPNGTKEANEYRVVDPVTGQFR